MTQQALQNDNPKAMLKARAIACLMFCCASLFINSVSAQSLQEVVGMASAGAPGLALGLMDQHQPDASVDAPGWFRWEQHRTAIYQQWQQWPQAIEHYKKLPANLPDEIRRWGMSQLAWFHLANNQGEPARQVLRQLLWASTAAKAEEIRLWRRLVIRSYLLDKLDKDALHAVQRYQQDYKDTEPQWRLLQIKVLLSADRASAASALIKGLEGEEGSAIKLLVRLKLGNKAKNIYKLAKQKARRRQTSARGRAMHWAVAAQAAKKLGNLSGYSLSLDQGARYQHKLTAEDDLFELSADALWDAYLDYGRYMANKKQLISGKDDAWFKLARSSAKKSPVASRSLLVVLALHGNSINNRKHAQILLSDQLLKEHGGQQVLKHLYLNSPRFADLGMIPTEVRYLLVDQALEDSDIDTAMRLFADLETPPEDANPFNWNLRRARVLIMGGQADKGAEALKTLFGSRKKLTEKQLDQFLQVVFDLQTADAHDQAIALLGLIQPGKVKPQTQRELWYWKADSYKAQGKFLQAARAYMRSATLFDPKANDMWGQSANYNAAEALTKAGLLGDARRMYEELLTKAGDETRAAVLRNQLQRLWLMTSSKIDVKPSE